MTKSYDEKKFGIALGEYTLITNLDWVIIGGTRVYTHALVIAKSAHGFEDKLETHLRGFGVDPSNPTFDYRLPAHEWKLVDGRGNAFVLRDNGEMESMINGAILECPGLAEKVQLICSQYSPKLDIKHYPPGSEITVVWEDLPRKVAEHWGAPNMPVMKWMPSALVRQALGVE